MNSTPHQYIVRFTVQEKDAAAAIAKNLRTALDLKCAVVLLAHKTGLIDVSLHACVCEATGRAIVELLRNAALDIEDRMNATKLKQ